VSTDSGEPSQVSINVDTADAKTLRSEIRRLDHRLGWMYRHFDEQGHLALGATYALADQRDAAKDLGRASGWREAIAALRDEERWYAWRRARSEYTNHLTEADRWTAADFLESLAPKETDQP
jgi:hypothetical protein